MGCLVVFGVVHAKELVHGVVAIPVQLLFTKISCDAEKGRIQNAVIDSHLLRHDEVFAVLWKTIV